LSKTNEEADDNPSLSFFSISSELNDIEDSFLPDGLSLMAVPDLTIITMVPNLLSYEN
jgi:hypothetical protein